MLDYLADVATRGAVIIPSVLIVAALTWFAARALGMLRPDKPFDRADMRTWPLTAGLLDGAIFSSVFVAAFPLVSDSAERAGLAAAIGAFTMISVALLMQRRNGD